MSMKRLPISLIALLGILLVSALGFFFAQTRDYDPSVYQEQIALLRQIKQLDARWELDVLKSKVGINKNYDPLSNPLADLTHLQNQLKQITVGLNNAFSTFLNAQIAEFERDLLKKTELIEQFKSHNAVLRNSLTFLPAASDDVRNFSLKGRESLKEKLASAAASVDTILQATLEYEQTESDEEINEIKEEVPILTKKMKPLPNDLNSQINTFLSHAKTAIREHGVVNELLKKISAVPIAMHIDAINMTLNSEQQRRAKKVQTYRQYLLIFSSVLVALFLYVVIHLIRSHALIKLINVKLTDANDNLEQRVLQRTQELEVAQVKLVNSARQAGMAEIATNVLHNVGNVLNSVNISAALVNNQVRSSKLPQLGKVTEMLQKNTDNLGEFLTNDPKGKMLPGYIDKLAAALYEEQKMIMNELRQLTKSIEHIKDVVSKQQSYAGVSTVFEKCYVDELIEDAIKMNLGSLSRHQISIKKEFEEMPPMAIDKHRVLQILINLISNAKNAVDGVREPAPQITIRLKSGYDDVNQKRTVQIQVADNGGGILPENMTRLFEHGFTTRADGHGFGLHSCVLAARQMRGSLVATSPGVNQGATFTLELPVDIDVDAGAPAEENVELKTKTKAEKIQ